MRGLLIVVLLSGCASTWTPEQHYRAVSEVNEQRRFERAVEQVRTAPLRFKRAPHW